MTKQMREEIYKMREQGVDGAIFNDVVQSEIDVTGGHPEDVIWDDDVLSDDFMPSYSTNGINRRRYDDFRNVGRRHYD